MQSARNHTNPSCALSDETRKQRDLLSFEDLPLFGITYTRPSIYRLIREGRFPDRVKLGPRRVVFRREDILAWIDELKEVRGRPHND